MLALELSVLKLYAQDKKVIIENDNRVIGVPQIKINNTVYVSVVKALELIGWSQKEDSIKNGLVFTKGDSTICIDVAASVVIIDGEKVTLEKPFETIDKEIYIQSKFIAERFGVQIRWSNKDNLIILSGYDEKSVYVEGEGNIIIAGNGIIINVFEAYTKDTIYDMLSYADRLLSKNKLEEAIDKYKDILNNISPDENQDLYVHVLINMGNAYGLLSETKDTRTNVSYAIEYCEKALDLLTAGNFLDSYISLLNNLGKLYRVSFEISNDRIKLDRSLEILYEAVDYKENISILGKALLFYNLGLTQKTANIKELAWENILKSISFYLEELKLHTLEKESDTYALIHYDIGNCFAFLWDMQGDEIRLDEAIEAYKEAMEVWSVESSPQGYAKVGKALGGVYKRKYSINRKVENLKLAGAFYKDSLRIFSKDKYKLDNAKINEEIAEIYYEYSIISDEDANIEKSICCLNEALLFFYCNGYVVDYNRVVFKLNKAYSYFLIKNFLIR